MPEGSGGINVSGREVCDGQPASAGVALRPGKTRSGLEPAYRISQFANSQVPGRLAHTAGHAELPLQWVTMSQHKLEDVFQLDAVRTEAVLRRRLAEFAQSDAFLRNPRLA